MKPIHFYLCLVFAADAWAGEMPIPESGKPHRIHVGSDALYGHMGKPGRRRGGRRRGGGRRGGSGGRNGSGYTRPKPKPFVKWALPPEEKLRELDKSLLESILETLGLNEEQKLQFAALQSRIKKRAEDLMREQGRARAVYEGAKGEQACREAGQAVVNAGAAVRNFDPMRELSLSAGQILSAEQYAKFRKLTG